MTPMRNRNVYMILFVLLTVTVHAFAQQNEYDSQNGKFKKENIFIGSGLNLALGTGTFNIGLNPEIGYSITHWLDAGLAFNLNYYSQNASDLTSNTSFRNFNYGGGPFMRVWPMNFLFIQAQPEYNWTTSNQKYITTGQTYTFYSNVSSFLLGVGYGTKIFGSHYSYISLMIDVLQNRNSPYRDLYTGDPLPVFRAGFGFYLKPRRQ